MLEHNINIGDRVEIYFDRPGNFEEEESSNEKIHLSQVENILGKNNEITINMPISYGHFIRLNIGMTYKTLFFTKKGMYLHRSKIVKHIVEGNFKFTVIELLTEGIKLQRREFYRLRCNIITKYSLLTEKENVDKKMGEVYDGIIVDLGGGGIRFISNQNLIIADKLKMIIVLEDEIIVANGKLLEKQRLSVGVYKYQYRVAFYDLEQSDREAIIRYIFEQQRRVNMRVR